MGNSCSADKTSTSTDDGLVKQETNSGKNIIELAQDFAEAAVDTAKQMGQAVVSGAAAVAEDIQEAAVDLKEAIEDTLDCLPTGVAVVEFTCPKGAVVKVDILSKQVGFEMGLSSSCCCKSGKAKTVVKKITAGGAPQKAGVKKNFVVKAINGTEVMGLEQAKKLLAEAVDGLPDTPPAMLNTDKEVAAAPAAAAPAPVAAAPLPEADAAATQAADAPAAAPAK